jgi:ferredoxin-NADP reductase
MKVILREVEAINHNVKTFWFESGEKTDYQAGQFIELSLLNNKPDDRGTKRWFTLSSSPTEKFLSITTKFSEPSSSFKSDLGRLKLNDKINMSVPMGDFVLPKDASVPIVFVAGGIGITPIRSMIKYLSDKKEKRNIQLLYAVNDEADLVFDDLFKSYDLLYKPVLSNPGKNWNGNKGKLSSKMINSLLKGISPGTLIYISGPEHMVESLNKDMTEYVNKDQLVGDYFPGYE